MIRLINLKWPNRIVVLSYDNSFEVYVFKYSQKQIKFFRLLNQQFEEKSQLNVNCQHF